MSSAKLLATHVLVCVFSKYQISFISKKDNEITKNIHKIMEIINHLE